MLNISINYFWKLVKVRSRLVTWLSISVCLGAANVLGDTFAIANPVSPQLRSQLTPLTSQSTSLTLEQLQSATYQIPLLGQVTLKNGTYQSQGSPSVVVTMSKKMVTGNFNQDGALDAVTVLRVTESGRKPTFYLAAIVNQNGKPNNADTLSLGQGFSVKSLSVKNQQVTVKLLKYRLDDAPCCPSDLVSQTYWFNPTAGELIATSLSLQDPNPGKIPVTDIPGPVIDNEINDNVPGSPAETEIEF